MLGGGRRRAVVFRHALLEAFDTLGDIAHHVRKTALAEQEQDENPDHEPVPDAEATHLKFSLRPSSSPLRRLLLGPARPSLPRKRGRPGRAAPPRANPRYPAGPCGC